MIKKLKRKQKQRGVREPNIMLEIMRLEIRETEKNSGTRNAEHVQHNFEVSTQTVGDRLSSQLKLSVRALRYVTTLLLADGSLYNVQKSDNQTMQYNNSQQIG